MAQSALEWGKEICTTHKSKSCFNQHSLAKYKWENSKGQAPGENMACGGLQKPGTDEGSSMDQYWDQMIDDELEKYEYPTNSHNGKCAGKTDKTKCFHYTQAIWGTTNEVGCAHIKCANFQRIVCHYWPAGNNKARPYKTEADANDYNGPLCCNCASTGNHGECGRTCIDAVNREDSWCRVDPGKPVQWDQSCKNKAMALCTSGGSTNNNNNNNNNNNQDNANCLKVSNVHSNMNGQWTKNGGNINGKPCYKKNGANKYIFLANHNGGKQWTMKGSKNKNGRNNNWYCPKSGYHPM